VLEDAGFTLAELPTLRFGDVDSLLAAEVVLLVERHLGRTLAPEAFDLTMPLTDVLALARTGPPPPPHR
jgi:acyl carrier protein